MPYIDVPITSGSMPAIDGRISSQSVRNMIVGADKDLYPYPYLKQLAAITNLRRIWYSEYNGGIYIAVSDDVIYTVDSKGVTEVIGIITFSALAITMCENLQNQVTITDGLKAYVYEIRKNNFVTLNETDHKFSAVRPISCVMLNSFTIIGDNETGKWYISDANNALMYDDLRFGQIEDALTKLMGVATIHNNLFIIGLNGVERWIPAVEQQSFDIPFQRDDNFRTNFGAVSTASIVSDVDNIYFLSSKSSVIEMGLQGVNPVTNPGQGDAIVNSGDQTKASGCFFVYKGYYFYQLTLDNDSWLYNISTKVWTQTDEKVLSAANNHIALEDGFYEFTDERQGNRKLEIITDVIIPPSVPNTYRATSTFFESKITQGDSNMNDDEYLELQISLDNQEWSNSVSQLIGKTGKRQAINTWRMNVSGHQFTYRWRYYGSANIALRYLKANIVQETIQ